MGHPHAKIPVLDKPLQWAETKRGNAIRTVNLKSDMPRVREALQRLDRELALARREGLRLLKIVHGYGSTGVGGDIRIAVQKRLHELVEAGQIRGSIFGENWSKSDEETCPRRECLGERRGNTRRAPPRVS